MSNQRIRRTFIVVAALMVVMVSHAQHVAVKTNLLNDALTTPNLGVEFGVGQRNTIQAVYALNPWQYKAGAAAPDRVMAKHWVLQPEFRWWTCSKFNGFFYGVHLMGGEFNAANINIPPTGAFFGGSNLYSAVKNNRVEGAFIGAGVTVGYQWILSKHWNLEAEVGAGYNHVWNREYPCSVCSPEKVNGQTNYAGLTKLGLSILYLF